MATDKQSIFKMKKYIFLIALFPPMLLSAQDKPVLKTEVSSDTIGMNGTLEIVFTLENAQLKKFNPPSFDGFDAQGPSIMTSVNMTNGVTTQSASYTYYLTPKKTGIYTIGSATAETNTGSVSSENKTITVFEQFDAPKKNNRSRFGFFEDESPNFFNVRPSKPKLQAQPKQEPKTKTYSTEDI